MRPARIKISGKRLRSVMGAVMTICIFSLTLPTKAMESPSHHVAAPVSLSQNLLGDQNARRPSLFGSTEQRYADIRPFTKWTGALSRFKKEFGADAKRPEVRAWMKTLSSLRQASAHDKIQAINDYMNQVHFVPDEKNYGANDYWATPMEFLAKGGDCEDYAMAKYISLRALGFRPNDMRLSIVYDHVMRMPHAVLIVYSEGKAEVLDNQTPGVMNAAEITRYKPIYSISQTAWWKHSEPKIAMN